MNVDTARIMARNCYKLSENFIEFSPAARIFMSDLGWSKIKFVSSYVRKIIRRILIWRMEKLILISDTSVQLIVLAAMKNLQHVSRNIGLIASFYNPKAKSQEERELSEKAYHYLFEVLDLKELDFFAITTKKIKHWQECLAIDYSEEFRIVRERIDRFTVKERQLSDEELEERLAESKKRTWSLARQDLREYWEKYLKKGFSQKRTKAVYEGLDNIFKYLFTKEENNEKIADVLQLLSQFATWKHFPESWLLILAEKQANQ